MTDYYVYWDKINRTAKIHEGNCLFANHGHGAREGTRATDGEWLPSSPTRGFRTKDEAEAAARATNARVSYCGWEQLYRHRFR